MKYVLVSGGVISGIGKGVVASSVGVLMRACGLAVTSIKIDPYINIDAGTFSPYEHGEVFVLDDGGEVDLDLGNYERFLDVRLHRDNNITTGKIFQHVIDKERQGDYLGKTVQVVPHLTEAIQGWVERVARVPVSRTDPSTEPQVCIIELGGTIGDIEGMPFIEAFRQFRRRVGVENFCSIHVTLVPKPKSTGEHKTKPTQASVKDLRGQGISPDVIICRSETPIGNVVKQKISNACDVAPEQVMNIYDFPTIYHVPLELQRQNLVPLLASLFRINMSIERPRKAMSQWRKLADKAGHLKKSVKIALVGKYTQLEDAYASVIKALRHAALAANYKLDLVIISSESLEDSCKNNDPVQYHQAWKDLCQCDGVLLPGGFGTRGLEGKIGAAQWARLEKKPFLGICLGFQCAVIEMARNVLGIEMANSTEVAPDTQAPLVIDMPEHNLGPMGGTMRLGLRQTLFTSESSVLRKLYGNVDHIEERHRHRYEVNTDYIKVLEDAGLHFVGHDVEHTRMEIFELQNHPYFVGVQFHPEYLSTPLRPSPPYLGLILAATNKLQPYLIKGCQSGMQPSLTTESRYSCDNSSDEEIASIVRNVSHFEGLSRLKRRDSGGSNWSTGSNSSFPGQAVRCHNTEFNNHANENVNSIANSDPPKAIKDKEANV